MEFRAEARYMRVSPQEARLVLNLIKGQRVELARNTLAFTKKRVAATVGKLFAVGDRPMRIFWSTEKGLDVDLDNLYVKHAVANDGPRMKRIRSSGRWDARITMCGAISHLEIVLAEKKSERRRSGRAGAGEKTAKAAPSKPRRSKSEGTG